MFIVFRFLLGTVGVTPLTVGGGSIADIMPADKRGVAMSVRIYHRNHLFMDDTSDHIRYTPSVLSWDLVSAL